MRRVLTALGILILPAIALAAADSQNHPLQPFLDSAVLDGYMENDRDGLFRPNRQITRGEFVKALVSASYGKGFQDEGSHCFTDFTGDEQPEWSYICFAKARGVLSGYEDGSFRAAKPVLVAEALSMAVKAWRIPLPAYVTTPDPWYAPLYDAIASWGNTDLLPIHRATATLTKQEAAVLLALFRGQAGATYSPTPGDIETGTSGPSAPKPGDGAAILHKKGKPAVQYTIDNPPPRIVSDVPAPAAIGRAPDIGNATAWQNSEAQSLDRLRGNVILLQFWEPNCVKCDRMLRAVNGLWAQYRELPFAAVTIVVPQTPHGTNVPEFANLVRQNEIFHPAGEDNKRAVWNAFGAPSLPYLVLIDANGMLRMQGGSDISIEDVGQHIFRLLEDAGAR